MRDSWGIALLTFGMLVSTAAHAQSSNGAVAKIETDLVHTQSMPLEEQARHWGLTKEEYRRYQEALAGPRGRLSATNISPIEVLGIEATTAAERRRYAEMWVQMIRADTDKVLAFTRSVHETWKRKHPNDPLIDRHYVNRVRAERGERPIPLGDASKLLADPTKVGNQDQLLMFTEVGCDDCNADVLRLVDQLQAGDYAGLDIYLLDVPAGDVAPIQSWAGTLAIPLDLVQSGRLTLNFDGGAFQSLTESMQLTPARFPVVMRRQGQSYDLVSLR